MVDEKKELEQPNENKLEKSKERLKSIYENQKTSKTDENVNADLGSSEKNDQTYKSVILFFSIDIVNSTLYKTTNYYGWVNVLNTIFSKIHDRVKTAIPEPESELWRVLGDEVIFIVKIPDNETLLHYMTLLDEIFVEYLNKVKSGEIFDMIFGKKEMNQNEIKLMKLQNVLSLKATSWIAIVTHSPDMISSEKFDEYENVLTIYKQNQKKHQFFEFLGNDIDAGFRLAKEAYDGRHIISFELAYLLSTQSRHMKNLHIITYKQLNGIWKNRLYPIIWYHDGTKNVDFADSFAYDELAKSNIVKEYFDNINGKNDIIRDKRMFDDVLFALNKILQDNHLSTKIDRINELLKEANSIKTEVIEEQLLELHCVAVCVDVEKERILIAKRSESRTNHPGYWDFGCAKANAMQSMEDSLKKSYKELFDLDISVVLDNEREDKQPIPIALYKNPKKNDEHKGIITIAKANNVCELKNKNEDEYSSVRWVTRDEIEGFTEKKITDFKNTAKMVFDKIERMKKQNE